MTDTRHWKFIQNLRCGLVAACLAVGAVVAPVVAAPAAPAACDPKTVWGFCLNTLPRLACCSEAAVAWSGIVVGQRFPVSGRIHPDSFVPAVQKGLRVIPRDKQAVRVAEVRFPSGRRVALPVDANGTFRGTVTFDEEGAYSLSVGNASMNFDVAYRATPLDATRVEDLFDSHHRMVGQTVVALPFHQPTTLRVRFTDSLGRPGAGRTLAFRAPAGPVVTDAEGVAAIPYTAGGSFGGYELARLYPGLLVQTFHRVRMEGDTLKGLPGGDVQGKGAGDGREPIFPLRDFLAGARPDAFAGPQGQGIHWDAETRTIQMADLSLMVDTGHVLRQGRVVLTVGVENLEGRVHMKLRDLADLFDLTAMAALARDGSLLLSEAALP